MFEELFTQSIAGTEEPISGSGSIALSSVVRPACRHWPGGR